MWMDTGDLKPKDSKNDNNNPPLIHEGEFYYAHHDGFKPEIYLDLIKLAMLVTGEPTCRALDKSIERIDRVLNRSKYSKKIKQKEYNARYGIIQNK
jgi:hypothetical protein